MTRPIITASDYRSEFDFVQTLARLVSAIEGAGMRIFATLDHASGARDVGLEMPPTVVLIYGNPRAGTPVMLANPAAALDLPLRVLVHVGDDRITRIGFHPIVPLLRQYGTPDELAMKLEPAQRLLLRAVEAKEQ